MLNQIYILASNRILKSYTVYVTNNQHHSQGCLLLDNSGDNMIGCLSVERDSFIIIEKMFNHCQESTILYYVTIQIFMGNL